MLRLNRDVSKKDRIKRVEEMLEFVSLDRCLHSTEIFLVCFSQLNLKKAEKTLIGEPGRIKGLSGGEKRRLLFASEVCVFLSYQLSVHFSRFRSSVIHHYCLLMR